MRPFDGTVVQCNEQGLLACFGYPVAYEDAAVRAARAGLGLLDEMKALGEQLRQDKLELNPWVGIHTGPAIVEVEGRRRSRWWGTPGTSPSGWRKWPRRPGHLHRGHPPAVPGPVSMQQPRPPEDQGRGPARRTLPGGEDRGGREPDRGGGAAELSPLTGRDHEISLLKDRWEQAQEGMGQVVLLVGEPGLGKSRLVHTLKEHVLGQMVEGEVDAPVIEWRCSPHFQNTGLYPAIDFYERALGFGREEPPQDRFDRLLRRLAAVRPGPAGDRAAVGVAAVAADPGPVPAALVVAGPPEGRDVPAHAGVAAHARRPQAGPVRRRGPALGGRVHPGVPGAVPRRGPARPILTLLTFRPEFKPPWPAVAHQTSLALNRLTRRQVGDLMRKKAESTLPEAVIEQVYDRTGGVPLFVEEFTKMVQESGALERGGAGRCCSKTVLKREIPSHAPGPDDGPPGPDGGRAGGGPARRGARPRVQPRVARRRRDRGRADPPGGTGQAGQAEILYPKGRPPRCTYIFKHALLEDAVYNALVKGKRQQFHRRIAEVLEAQFPQTAETQPELLRHHFTEAGLTEKAVGYWLKAGLRSRERSANVEAIGHLTKGLALLDTLAESPERDAQRVGVPHPAGPGLHRGPRLCRSRSRADLRPGARTVPADRGNRTSCSGSCWASGIRISCAATCACVWTWPPTGWQSPHDVERPRQLMEALFMPGVTMFYRAEFAGARESCSRRPWRLRRPGAHEVLDGSHAPRRRRDPPLLLALSLWHLGYPDQARQLDSRGAGAGATTRPTFWALHRSAPGRLAAFDCRLGAEGQAAGRRRVEIAYRTGLSALARHGPILTGAGLLLQGYRGGTATLLKGLASFRATGRGSSLSHYLGMLGDAYTQAGSSLKRDKRWTKGWRLPRRTTTVTRRPSCTASRANCSWPRRTTKPPPRNAFARPSRRPAGSRAGRGSFAPQ